MAADTTHETAQEDLFHLPLEDLAPAVLRQGGVFTFMATGGSMWPHIRHGDTVTAAPISDGETPRTGWIIIYFTMDRRIAVHRVLSSPTPGLLRVRGDAIKGSPELIPFENLLGRIITRKRHGRAVDLTGSVRELQGIAIALTGSVRVFAERSLKLLLNLFRKPKRIKD